MNLMEHYEHKLARTKDFYLSLPWENKEFYARWLDQKFYFLAHASRLTSCAGSRLGLEDDKWHLWAIQHSVEEKHHEKLAAKDIEALGYSLGFTPEMPSTSFLYQSQYYLMEHFDGLALVGAVLFLEGISLSIGPSLYERTRHAFGEQAVSFLRVHVQEDIDHIADLHRVISEIPKARTEIIKKSMDLAEYAHVAMSRDVLTSLTESESLFFKVSSPAEAHA